MLEQIILVFLLPIILLICGIIGMCLILSRKLVNLARILLMLPILGALFFVGFVSAVIVALTSKYANIFIAMIIAFGILIAIVIACALWKVLKKKAVYIPICVCFAVCLGLTGATIAYRNFDANILTIGESDNILYDYVPYGEDTKVAELDGPSTLTIDSDVPKLDGATALYPIYSAFAKAVYPKELIQGDFVYGDYITCNTTTGAYETIVTGESDIIFVAGPSEEQKQFAAENGVELTYTPIGKEAFVFFVNSKNPIDNLTLEQVQAIYSGEITSWDDLGVEGLGNIRAFQRDEGSGSQSTLKRIMTGKELMSPPMEDVVSGMGGIIARAADYKNYKNAIGFSFRFYSTEMVKNDQIKLLSINGVAPTIENIENGTYPLASYFYAVTRSDSSENTKKLVDWILSDQGSELIEKTGYTPLSNSEVVSDNVNTEDILPEKEPLTDEELEELNALRPDYDYGTCQDLSGNVTVALLFLDDFESKWDDESSTRFFENEALPALEFLEQQALRYGVDLNFTTEVYTDLYYDEEVIINSKETGYVTADTLSQAATELGYRSDDDLHKHLKSSHGNDEVIYLTIFNKNGTGYALNPKRGTDYDFVEHSIIFAHDLNSDRTEPSGSQASVIAMEIVYLYGAENLKTPDTRKELAEFLYPKDVMLYAQYSISDNAITDITAFNVGWTNEVPQAFSFVGWNAKTE